MISQIFLVKQYQPTSDYHGEPIYCYTKEEHAIQAARNLNKTYGDNCIFSMEGDYVESLNEDNCHFYIVDTLVINDSKPKETVIPEQEQYYDCYVIKAGWFYVGDNDTKVSDIENAKKFETWDEARCMLKVLDSLDIYDCGPLYIKGLVGKVIPS